MKHILPIALFACWLSLLPGCGGGGAPVPETPKEKPAAAPMSAPPPIAKSEPPPALPKTPDAAPTASSPTPPASEKPAPKESVASKPAEPEPAAPKKSGKPDEFDPEVIGGKPIGTYVKQLSSANKDDVIEALNALKFVPKKAEKYLPRITELTKSADKEIAQEAADAIKTISGK